MEQSGHGSSLWPGSAYSSDDPNPGGYLLVGGTIAGTGGGALTNTGDQMIVTNNNIVFAGIPGYSYTIKYSSTD